MEYDLSEYDASYAEGVVNKSITISTIANELLYENQIQNISKFINALVLDALQDREFFKKKLISKITKARNELEKEFNTKTNFEVENLVSQ